MQACPFKSYNKTDAISPFDPYIAFSLMAIPRKLVVSSLVFLLFLVQSGSSPLLLKDGETASSAKPPAFNLALPGDGAIAFTMKPWLSSAGEQLPDRTFPSFGRRSGAGATASSSGRSFRQMFLNALPKGPVTPSGPSKGTNHVKPMELRN